MGGPGRASSSRSAYPAASRGRTCASWQGGKHQGRRRRRGAGWGCVEQSVNAHVAPRGCSSSRRGGRGGLGAAKGLRHNRGAHLEQVLVFQRQMTPSTWVPCARGALSIVPDTMTPDPKPIRGLRLSGISRSLHCSANLLTAAKGLPMSKAVLHICESSASQARPVRRTVFSVSRTIGLDDNYSKAVTANIN